VGGEEDLLVGQVAPTRNRLARAILPCAALLTATGVARAQESAYCAKVRALAVSGASLQVVPRLFVQEIRFPRSGLVDVGTTVGIGWQTRIGASYSLVDLYKGLVASRLADADCAEHSASRALRDFLDFAGDLARRAALEAQAAFLREHRDEWRALVDRSAQRLAERIITVADFNVLSGYVYTLEEKLVQAEGEASRIERGTRPVAAEPPGVLAERLVAASMEKERQASRSRAAEAWHFQVTGAVIPASQGPVDWYGFAEIGYSPGGVALYGAEKRYLEARSEELRTARYEMIDELRRFRAQADASLAEAKQELALVERNVALLSNARSLLEGSEASAASYSRDLITAELLAAESDRIFFTTLSGKLIAITEERHGQ
jgi:hypothetical protein